MAYNFPVSYQPYYPQQYQPQQGNSLIWIQGEAAAKSYLVAPNTTVALWDSESQTVYLKSCDASGMPSMRILDYTIRETQKQPVKAAVVSNEDSSIREEINALKGEIKAIKDKMSEKEVPEG